jgi:hypothetical protein
MRQFRVKVAVLAAVLATGFVGVVSTPASGASAAPTAITKSCSSGYVHAVLSWGHKCLRAGQFCKVGNREYLRYGFYCPSSGHLRRK